MRRAMLFLRVALVVGLALLVDGSRVEAEVNEAGMCNACASSVIWCGDWDAADVACRETCGGGTTAQQTSCAQGDCMPTEIQYICE